MKNLLVFAALILAVGCKADAPTHRVIATWAKINPGVVCSAQPDFKAPDGTTYEVAICALPAQAPMLCAGGGVNPVRCINALDVPAEATKTDAKTETKPAAPSGSAAPTVPSDTELK